METMELLNWSIRIIGALILGMGAIAGFSFRHVLRKLDEVRADVRKSNHSIHNLDISVAKINTELGMPNHSRNT